MYGAVTPVLIDKWRPPTADEVWLGGRVYLKQILQAFPLSPLPLPRFYFFALLFTSRRSPLSERLEQAISFVFAVRLIIYFLCVFLFYFLVQNNNSG